MPVYIESLSNAVADVLSRSFVSHGATLAPHVLGDLEPFHGFYTVPFPTYSLPPLPPGNLRAAPPWHLLPQYLRALLRRKTKSMTVVPFWPH